MLIVGCCCFFTCGGFFVLFLLYYLFSSLCVCVFLFVCLGGGFGLGFFCGFICLVFYRKRKEQINNKVKHGGYIDIYVR